MLSEYFFLVAQTCIHLTKCFSEVFMLQTSLLVTEACMHARCLMRCLFEFVNVSN